MSQQQLIEAATQLMPYGKYRGYRLIDLPEPYLVWMNREGFSDTQLGRQLALIYEIKLNGLDGMVRQAVLSTRNGYQTESERKTTGKTP
jgi:uncharacterized protein